MLLKIIFILLKKQLQKKAKCGGEKDSASMTAVYYHLPQTLWQSAMSLLTNLVTDHVIMVLKRKNCGGCPRAVMVKAMDCEIVVSEFELQLHYYDHFRTNTLVKGMNPLILPAMG